MTTTPKPPKGRRWLRVGEILRPFDWFHCDVHPGHWINTTSAGARVPLPHEYSRAIRRKGAK